MLFHLLVCKSSNVLSHVSLSPRRTCLFRLGPLGSSECSTVVFCSSIPVSCLILLKQLLFFINKIIFKIHILWFFYIFSHVPLEIGVFLQDLVVSNGFSEILFPVVYRNLFAFFQISCSFMAGLSWSFSSFPLGNSVNRSRYRLFAYVKRLWEPDEITIHQFLTDLFIRWVLSRFKLKSLIHRRMAVVVCCSLTHFSRPLLCSFMVS